MFGLKVFLSETEIPVHSIGQIDALIDLLVNFKRLHGDVYSKSSGVIEIASGSRQSRGAAGRPPKMDDFILKAWEKLGRPQEGATAQQIYDAMVEDGFTSSSEKPVRALNSAISHGKRFDVIKVLPNRANVYRLKEDGTTTNREEPATLVLEKKRNRLEVEIKYMPEETKTKTINALQSKYSTTNPRLLSEFACDNVLAAIDRWRSEGSLPGLSDEAIEELRTSDDMSEIWHDS